MAPLSRAERFALISVSLERMPALVLEAEVGARERSETVAEGVEGPEVKVVLNLEAESRGVSQGVNPGREKVGIIRIKRQIVQ